MPGRVRRAAPAVARVALALLCSCLAYRAPGGSRRPSPDVPAAAAKSVSVLIRATGTYQGRDRELPGYILSQWKAAVLTGYRESGLFSRVTPGVGRADLQATVDIENQLVASRGLSFLGAVSFLALPFRHRDQFQISTTFTDGSGRELGVVRRGGEVVTWYQIALAPAALFFSRDAVVSDTLYELTLETAAQAQREGLL